jgi:curved DNA-binding protein CbpA
LSDERARTTKPVHDSRESHVTTASSFASAEGVTRTAAPAAERHADAAALAEDVDLSPDLQEQLISMENGEVDHYTMLGVDPAADKKAIKRAYYQLAAKFHPDKHFRKKLGSFKLRLEAYFSRLTIAHETLGNPTARAEYDEYLDVQRRSRQIEQLMAEAALEARRAEENVEREIRAQERPAASALPPLEPATKGGTRLPTSSPGPAVDAAARRDAFARRLLGGRAPATSSAPPSHSSSPPPTTMSATDAMSALRRRYEERLVLAKAAEARKCTARGEQALASGEVIKAANAFRIASGLAPGDADLERKSRECQAKADTLLAETYARQAEYEEKSNAWPAAARSWVRVCQARLNDAHAHGRAAEALIKAGGDLHHASRLAQRACELEPATASARITLANVYLAAELTQNARRELETALKLGARDGVVDAMLKRLGPPT